VIQPYAQTDWSGRTVRAAFATTDPILAIFFAVIRREAVRSIRNGGFLIEPSRGAISPGAVKSEIVIERFYFFTVEEADSSGRSDLLADGFVHVVDRDGFATSDAPIRFDEWRSPSVGPVVMRLPVSPEDFPFRGSIVRHGDESVVHSWLRYKERLARQAG